MAALRRAWSTASSKGEDGSLKGGKEQQRRVGAAVKLLASKTQGGEVSPVARLIIRRHSLSGRGSVTPKRPAGGDAADTH